MKKYLDSKYLPVLIAICGGIGMVLRLQLYAAAVDEKGLLIPGHPLELLLAGLTAAVLVKIVLALWPLYGSVRYEDNFPASKTAAAGAVAAAAGIVLTVLLEEASYTRLGYAWKLAGLVCGPCLVLTAYCRLQGRKPHFLLHGGVCVFFLLHMICNYQTWSVNPQLQDYLFPLFASVGMLMFSYYQTAFAVGSGKRRKMLAVGLGGGYFALVALSGSEAPLLYGGCAAWALTNLCSLTPVRRRSRPVPEGE